MKTPKTLLSAGIFAALTTVSSVAGAVTFNDFVVDPNGVDTANDILGGGPFTADKITGNYDEVVTFNVDGTFSTAISWVAGQFVQNDGTDPLIGLTTQLGNDYGIYATLNATGTYNTSGGVTTFVFNPGGSLDVWLDSYLGGVTTALTAPLDGTGSWTTSNNGDDVKIATGEVLSGAGTLDPSLSTCGPGINCGSFGVNTSFVLEPGGNLFFTGPDPFWNVAFDSGQLNNFDVSGTQRINGSLDVVYAGIPEPSTLALVGLGLLGMGAAARRKKAAG